MISVKLDWKKGMCFEAGIRQHTLIMDTRANLGGEDQGPTPKELVLSGLVGCTGIDVVYILKKMRLEIEKFWMDAQTSTTEGQPSVFDHVHLIYHLEGQNLPLEKVVQAVELSQSKYCGVSAMIAKVAKITYEIELNGKSIGKGEAKF